MCKEIFLSCDSISRTNFQGSTDIGVWLKSASKGNHQGVTGSIPTTDEITRNSYNSLKLVPGHS